MKRTSVMAACAAAFLLSACQPTLQGLHEDDIYYSPREAYGIPLYTSPFRGTVTVEERCNTGGGSATFFDESGRYFRIDYLKIDEHPMAQAPRFASDQTLLNAVINNYLRDILPEAATVEDIDATVREFLKERDPRALFVIVNLNVNPDLATAGNESRMRFLGLDVPKPRLPTLAREEAGPVRGTYYYGFLLFKRGEFVYVVQHYQPALMREKMLQVLTRLADHMIIPGKSRDDTELEKAAQRWIAMRERMGLQKQVVEDEDESPANPVRPCQ